jgi:uncharacterized membrane protein
MSKKDKFKFVKKEEENFLIDEEEIIKEEPKEKTEERKLTDEELIILEKKKKRRKLILTAVIMFLISNALFWFVILWQNRLDLLAVTDALTVTVLLIFAGGWVMLIWNMNILSPLIHGIKTFGLMFVGKKPKLDYYSYTQKIQDEPISKYYIFTCFITAGILLIPTVILLIIVLI